MYSPTAFRSDSVVSEKIYRFQRLAIVSDEYALTLCWSWCMMHVSNGQQWKWPIAINADWLRRKHCSALLH